jgi:membrane protease YdiL (CAAX protease family)
MEQAETSPSGKSLWRRIVDYPLVTMILAIAIFIVTITIAAGIVKLVPLKIPGFTFDLKFDVLAIVLLLLIYELVIRRMGEHPRDDYRDPRAMRRLLIGLVAGFAVFSVAVAVAAVIGVYHVNGRGDLSQLLPALIASALFPAVNEELLFRGILFRWLEEWGGSWVALLLTSALFGCAHLLNPNASPIAAVGIAFEAGVMLGAAYMLTRSLWLPMGLHAAWNFAQGEVYDIPVSGMPVHGMVNAQLSGPPLLTGNGFGLEASVIAIVVATLFGLYLLWMAIKKGELVQPRWVRRRQLAAEPVAA